MTNSHPLRRPDGWPRTEDRDRSDFLMGWNRLSKTPLPAQTSRLHDEVRLLGATDIVLSTNHPVRQDGGMANLVRRMEDPGAAVHFLLDAR